MVCGCILRLQSVIYLVLGHCDLDFFLELLCQEHMSYIILYRNPKFRVRLHLWIVICSGSFRSM